MAVVFRVCQRLSGEAVTTIPHSGQSVLDVKNILEDVLQTPAQYLQLFFQDSEETLKDIDKISSDIHVILVMRTPCNSLDFVCACRDATRFLDKDFCIRYMIDNGADVNAKITTSEPSDHYQQSFGYLQIAMGVGSLHDATALHYACKHGLTKVCHFLLACPTFTQVNAKTSTPPHFEEEMGGRCGSGPDCELTALLVAILSDHEDLACIILQCDRFIEVNNFYNLAFMKHCRSAFANAAVKGQVSVCTALLQHPLFTGLNDVDDYDVTVLMLAALRNTEENAAICRLILEDSRFNKLNCHSCTGGAGHKYDGHALDFAERSGLTEICDLIRRHPQFSSSRNAENFASDLSNALNDVVDDAVYTWTENGINKLQEDGMEDFRDALGTLPVDGERVTNSAIRALADALCQFDAKMLEILIDEGMVTKQV